MSVFWRKSERISPGTGMTDDLRKMSAVSDQQSYELSPQTLLSEVASSYDLAVPCECVLINAGLNDVYLIKTSSDPVILKIYRAGWRTRSEVHYEVDVLLHLGRKGVPVSLPLARRDGSFTKSWPGPDGLSHAVLFAYAKGEAAGRVDERYCYLFGRAAAEVHHATDDFASPHARFYLDLEHLLSQPLDALEPLLESRPEAWSYLTGLARRLREELASLPAGAMDWGCCHGDLAPNNAHLSEDGLTLFDFDCGGPGWRSYDIALFRTFLADERQQYVNHERLWEAFLSGYQERRPVDAVGLRAVSLFVAMRQIWVLGVHARLALASGFGRLPPFFEGMLEFLQEWEEQAL
jgi:Ser/Thr protein kinase RdoA (MazF antagonist)